VAPLTDGTLRVVINIAALANTGAAMNLKDRIRLCLVRDNGIFFELKQSGFSGWVSVVRIIMVV
jgi:hypothetical protein